MQLISLSQGRDAIIDDEDFELVGLTRWHAVKMGTKNRPLFYAARNITIAKNKGRLELMHRRIMQAPAGMVVDHINHDTLDNRRANLRVCTQKQNMENQRDKPNKTGFRGVSKSGPNGYVATIRNGSVKYLGYFQHAEDAARAYDVAAIKEFGEFAKLNFPEGNVAGLMATR